MTDTGQEQSEGGENGGDRSADMMGGEDIIRMALEAAVPMTESGQADPFQLGLAALPQNDTGNGQRLKARFGEDLMFVRDVGWHAWIGTHWSRTEGDRLALIFAQQTARAIIDEAIHLKTELVATEEYLRPKGIYLHKATGEDKRVHALYAWALRSGDMNRCNAMLDAAKPHLTFATEHLDSDRYLFNVANGTLHLRDVGRDGRAVTLEKHRRQDRITKISPVVHDPDAKRPVFDAFMAKIHPPQPEDDGRAVIAEFLQTWFGYCLSAATVEQKLMMWLGTGANGKSTLEGAMMDVFGDYALSLPISSLMADDRGGRRGSEASPDLARLPGGRLVTASEPERGSKFSEGLIKQMTGSDKMTVRHLNQGFFDFQPTHKLCISMNNKPQVRGQDEGIWRRILLVPFDVQIPPEERDPDLPEKLRAERSGILNWLVDGFREWNANRLRVPDIVKAATDEYRSESDKVGQFLQVAVERGKGGSETAKALYDAFVRWCKLNAEDVISNTAFGRALTERGYHRRKEGIMFYENLRLVGEWVPTGLGGSMDGDDR